MTTLTRHAPAPGATSLEALLDAMRRSDPLPPFSPEATNFFAAFSEALLRHESARAHPEWVALAYWMRPAELERLRAAFERGVAPGLKRVPRGLAFHVPPANVDTMFIYSWVLSSLVGNRNVLRLSARSLTSGVTSLLEVLNGLLEAPEHTAMRRSNWVVGYGHDEDANRALSAACDVRVLWGGDATVNALRRFALPPHALELTFPDRFSMAALKAEAFLAAPQGEQQALARRFYADAYAFDQRGCASPRLVLWVGEPETCRAASERFFGQLQAAIIREGYALEVALALEKRTALHRALLDQPISEVRTWGPALSVLSLDGLADVRATGGGGGLFFEAQLPALGALAPAITRQDQTLAHHGFTPDELEALVRALNGRGLDRLVPIGEALSFQAVWDGYDLLQMLSRVVAIQGAPARRAASA